MGFNRVSVPRSWTPKDLRTQKIIRKCEFWRANLKCVRKKEHKMGSRDMQIDWLSQSDRCAYQSKWSATRLLTCWKKTWGNRYKIVFEKSVFLHSKSVYSWQKLSLWSCVTFLCYGEFKFSPNNENFAYIDDCEDVVVIIFQIRKCVFQVSFARFMSYICYWFHTYW